MKKAVFCIVDTTSQAERIVDELRIAGFSSNDISVLFPDKSTTRDFAHEKHTKAPEGATVGGVTGMGLGAILGGLVGIGTIAIPGLGPFIAAGPIVSALSGAAVGGATGGLIGALVGMGIPEYEAKRYEAKVKEGNVLISVHTDSSEQRSRVEDIMEKYAARDVATTSEADV